MKQYLKFLILLIGISLSAQQTLAVLDFEGIGISENEAKALSGRFGSEFMTLSKGVYTLVERNRMGQVLKEQGFQNTGVVSSEDAVKIGEALGAEYIVTGSISKVGTLFSINARLLNVQSAEIIKSISHDHMGDIMDLMTKEIKESATKLLDLKEKEIAPSIAILPFENKGADEDAFYAYGIVADLISVVTGAGLIRVAGLKDVEKIDHSNMSYDEMSKTLLVRYVAQGTLWKLGSMFQLSLEIFDTQTAKVIFTKRWQTEWEKLANIKDDLSSNILETLKIEVKQTKNNKITINPEAYEFYLKGKYKYEKVQSLDDTEIAKGLLKKATEIDENLIAAKRKMADIYWRQGGKENAKKAKEIHNQALEQAKKIGDKKEIAHGLLSVGYYHFDDKEYDKAMEFFESSMTIFEELGNQEGIASVFNAIGNVQWRKKKPDEALKNYTRVLDIGKKLDDKIRIITGLNNISLIHMEREDHNKAIDFLKQALSVSREFGNANAEALNLNNIGWNYQASGDIESAIPYFEQHIALRQRLGQKDWAVGSMNGLGWSLFYMGNYNEAYKTFEKTTKLRGKEHQRGKGWDWAGMATIHFYKGEFEEANKFMDRIFDLRKEHEIEGMELQLTTFQYLIFRELGKDFDLQVVRDLIKDQKLEDLNVDAKYELYQLLGDKSFLKKAYEDVQKKANKLEGEKKESYLNYPIEKLVIEEYNRVMN
ncbi:MAG: tetratricopeptide repeat protein [Candidatus Neomarinimicrobiota bacterium]|nr:tetratricopeptide repeat protein [Candidatus Neomarinimicrobiota bacterium]